MSSAVAASSPGAESAAKQYASDKAAPLTHVLLVVITLVSLFFPVPPNINVILTASLAVFAGCWRSIKPEPSAASESMTKGEAMRFPLYGSMVLFGLFLAFKFLPKELVNMLLNFYIGLISVVVLTTSLLPYVIDYFPKGMQKKKFTFLKINIPALGIDTKTEPFTFSAAETVVFLISTIFCSWYIMKRHWVANNVLGLAMSLEGIEHLNLGSVHVGCILLVGLFIYDIFWVFCTPVMVSVAKNFDAPIKLLFPRALDMATGKRAFSMLGLGDIVIPGIFVALMLRMDVHSNFKKRYFYSAFFGYVLGLATTIVVMNVFNAAQPALLYIVPAVLGSVALHATIKGELMQVFNYSESDDSRQPTEAGADSKKDK